MRLTDIMSNLDLSVFPQVALVLFLGVFVAVSVAALRRKGSQTRRLASLPLEDDGPGGVEGADHG